MFIHKEVDFDSMSRETIDGVRYYHIPGAPISWLDVLQSLL